MSVSVPYKPADVRKDYLDGVWEYAIGKPANKHPRYQAAVALAEDRKFNPWWIRTYQDVCAVLDGCRMDEGRGLRVASFFTLFKHSKGKFAKAKDPRFHLMDWQRWDIVVPLFGWMRADGTRRFRVAYIEIPKKNGKSSICSGLGLYLTGWDNEPGAEVYVGAVDSNQANIIHRQSRRFVKQSPTLRKRLKINDTIKRISYEHNDSWFQVLTKDAENQEGLNAHGVIFDETHVHKDRKLYDTMADSGAARDQQLIIMITTAGVYDPTSIGWEQHEYATRIQSGQVEDWSWFAYIATAGEDAQWDDIEAWKRANPSWGEIINEDNARDRIRTARDKPSERNNIKRYRLNIWTQQKEVWIPDSEWSECADEYTPESLHGRTCYGGLDLSLSDDLTAFSLWFPPEHDDEFHRCLTWYYLPEDTIEDHDRHMNGAYSRWVEGGYIVKTPNNTIDHAAIREHVLRLNELYRIHSIRYDSTFAESLRVDLEHEGLMMVKHPQLASEFNEALMSMGNLIKSRKFLHNDNPVTNWQMGNCQVVHDLQGRMKLMKIEFSGRKKATRRLKIDGPVAMAMAHKDAITSPDEFYSGGITWAN